MSVGPRTVVVVHDAQRTGPPIYALDLLRWLAAHTDLDVAVVLVEGGPLEADFAAVGPTVLLAESPAVAAEALAAADLVYVNTAASIRALAVTGVRPRRVLSHVHELDVALRHYLPAEDHDLLIEVTDRFLVGPECARRNLIEHHDVPAASIGRVPYFVPQHAPPDPTAASTVRHDLGLSPDTVVIGACGTRDWRKAPDVFAQLAWELRRRDLGVPLHFLWLGSPIASVEHWDEATDMALLGLEGHLGFIEHQSDPLRWMAAFDVFVLTSREDTFPLVCLEAGSLGLPIVCFDNGGIPELVAASDGGRVVPFLDVPALADAVEALVLDAGLRREQGQNLRAHIEANHGIDRCAGLVADEIRRMAA